MGSNFVCEKGTFHKSSHIYYTNLSSVITTLRFNFKNCQLLGLKLRYVHYTLRIHIKYLNKYEDLAIKMACCSY